MSKKVAERAARFVEPAWVDPHTPGSTNKRQGIVKNGYYFLVSRFFIILLIVLLPMRGWSADRMAVDMAASELASHVIGAGQHNSMPEDCLLSIDSDASDAGLSPPMGDDERGCQACQLCMSLAPYEVLAAMSVAMQSIAVDLALVECFVSADRARAVKPPIS